MLCVHTAAAAPAAAVHEQGCAGGGVGCAGLQGLWQWARGWRDPGSLRGARPQAQPWAPITQMVSEHNDYVGLTTTSKTKLAGYLAAAFSQVRAAQCSVCVWPQEPQEQKSPISLCPSIVCSLATRFNVASWGFGWVHPLTRPQAHEAQLQPPSRCCLPHPCPSNYPTQVKNLMPTTHGQEWVRKGEGLGAPTHAAAPAWARFGDSPARPASCTSSGAPLHLHPRALLQRAASLWRCAAEAPDCFRSC